MCKQRGTQYAIPLGATVWCDLVNMVVVVLMGITVVAEKVGGECCCDGIEDLIGMCRSIMRCKNFVERDNGAHHRHFDGVALLGVMCLVGCIPLLCDDTEVALQFFEGSTCLQNGVRFGA